MSIKRQVLKIALCFLGALVIFAALAATIALAAVSYGLAERISGYIHLASVRKQMTRSGNLPASLDSRAGISHRGIRKWHAAHRSHGRLEGPPFVRSRDHNQH